MTYHIGVLMDPIASINPKKDSTLAMMLAAQERGWLVSVFTQSDLLIEDGAVSIRRQVVNLMDDTRQWFEIVQEEEVPAEEFDAILMRKDPPFDMEYIYATYLLEIIEDSGTPVLNRPGSIRDCNEKLFALRFPQCSPPHIVSRDQANLRSFHQKHGDVIYKPLDGMGGDSIFRATEGEHNLSVIIETLTNHGQTQTMAQKYIPEIVNGDTRILMINGEPVPYGLARVPLAGETRGNLAAGGSGVGRELNERDRFICDQVSPVLKEKGLYFVGIDVIGDYLTEINVTCPTCIRELNAEFGIDIGGDYMQFIENEIFKTQ
ncbi:MAG: glutathione synthase [Gammaproteobacteria bacterium]|nr:glutathione synthase [Gammaproteobacteria bacterium]MBT4493895.1 glutathione synthase [Gammaproteobacteria bacterium]MBT7372124.1 glutathione synthase [Gammaproteobacteria bacterium]